MNVGGAEDSGGSEPLHELGEALAPPDPLVAHPLPAPSPHLVAVSSMPPSDDNMGTATSSPPTLPNVEARAPVPMVSHAPVVGASTWYRTDQQRYKSVYRRANPWYRRLGRAVVGLAAIAVLAGLLYVGAQQVQDYLNRDKLPKPGEAAPEFASTSFLVTSSSPAPELNGTITVDTASHAFEFVGGGGTDSPQSGLEIVSPDGTRVYVRQDNGSWHEAADGDDDVAAIMQAMPYLLGVRDADDILENKLRKNYTTLIDETTEGVSPDVRERYEMTFDTANYSSDYPLQWENLQDSVIPGAVQGNAVPVTMWIDDEHVVVRLRDEETHWAWERLAYSDERFTPIDPGGVAVPAAPVAPTPTMAPAG